MTPGADRLDGVGPFRWRSRNKARLFRDGGGHGGSGGSDSRNSNRMDLMDLIVICNCSNMIYQ